MPGSRGGRFGGRDSGRGNINISEAELNALINDRVAKALAAFQNNLKQVGINWNKNTLQPLPPCVCTLEPSFEYNPLACDSSEGITDFPK